MTRRAVGCLIAKRFVDGYSARRAAHRSIRAAWRAGSQAAISPTAISSSVTIVNTIGSVACHPEQERLQHTRQPGGPGQADDLAGDDDAERAPEHEAEDVAAVGAERHANGSRGGDASPRIPSIRHFVATNLMYWDPGYESLENSGTCAGRAEGLSGRIAG